MGLLVFFLLKFEWVFYRYSLFHTIFAICNSYYHLPPTHTNSKTTVKISKSKAIIFEMLGSVPVCEVKGLRFNSRPWTCRFFTLYEARVFRFTLALIVHFLSVCVVSAVASSECTGLSTVSPPEAAIAKIDEHRGKQCIVIV